MEITIDDLPLDVKNLISSFIGDATKRQLRLANTKWFKSIDYRNFTLYLTKPKEWKQIVDRFVKYTKPISLSLKKNVIRDGYDMFEQFTRLTNLNSFEVAEFCPYEDRADWLRLTSLSNLKHLRAFFNAPSYIRKELRQLETFATCGTFEIVEDKVTCLTNLRKLEISCPHYVDNPFAFITDAHSKLTYLHLNVNACGAWTDKDLQRLRRLKYFKFHFYHKNLNETRLLSLQYMTDLEELHTPFHVTSVDLATNLRALVLSKDFPPLTAAQKKLFPYLYRLTRLENLNIEVDTSYLTALTNLEKIKILGRPEVIDESIYSVLGSLASTKLVQLGIHHVYSPDYGYFTQLGSIQDLEIEQDWCDHHVSVLTNLTSLVLNCEVMHDDKKFIEGLGTLTKLKRLVFHTDTETENSVNLSLLTNLESLDVYLCDVYGEEKLTNLTYLKICNYDLDFLTSNITKLVNLREFECEMGPEYIHYVSKLTNLRSLHVDKFYNEEDLLHLTALKHLTSLQSSNTQDPILLGVYMTNLTTLQKLTWRFNKVLAREVQQLSNFIQFYGGL